MSKVVLKATGFVLFITSLVLTTFLSIEMHQDVNSQQRVMGLLLMGLCAITWCCLLWWGGTKLMKALR